MLPRRSGVLIAGGLVLGLAAAGIVWSAIVSVAALLIALLASGVAGQLLLGGRVDPRRILVAGAVGAILGTAVSRFVGWPALVSIGGIPLIWAVAGAVVILGALRLGPGAQSR